MNITLNNTDLTLTDKEMQELRKFVVLHHLSGKFYLAADGDGDVDCYEEMPVMYGGVFWNGTGHTKQETIRVGCGVCKTWIDSLTIVNVKQLLSIVPVAHNCSLDVKPKQADFLDELADLLARYDASILSNNNIDINIKGKIVGHHAIRRHIRRPGNMCNAITARTIRKFRLRSKVV